MIFKKNYFLLTLFLLFSFMAKGQNLTEIRDEARMVFLVGAEDPTQVDYLNLMTEIDGTGEFTSIDYPSHNFDDEHLKKLVELTQVWALIDEEITNEYDGINKTLLETKIVAGLNWWYVNVDYYVPSVGWWPNEIGKQRELHKISILFYNYLNNSSNNTALELKEPGTTNSVTIYHPSAPTVGITNIKDAISADFVTNIDDNGPTDPHTGANKADVAGSIIAKGLLEDTQSYVNDGKAYLECVMSFATNVGPDAQNFDGIREDYSFNQHNKRNNFGDDFRRGFLYDGDYGLSAIRNIGIWGRAFTGDSNYDFDSNARDNFLAYVLEGYRWKVIGNMTDYSANGRNISRRYPNNNAAIPPETMDNLIAMAPDFQTELQAMQGSMVPNGKQNFNGRHHKYFWISDYVCHQEDEYFFSLRMCSDRTLGTETSSDMQENKLGFWLPYGCTFIYRDGDEYIRQIGGDGTSSDDYENIFPFWDWSYVPGVTCPVITNLLPGDNDTGEANNNTQTEEFVGNASNDSYGVSTMRYDKDYPGGTVTANKAWFHFGEEIIALGGNITGTDVHTTVNQSLFDSEYGVLYGGDILPIELPASTTDLEVNTDYVFHDVISYIFPEDPIYFPEGQNVHISNAPAPDAWDWSRIDDCTDNPMTNENECLATGSGHVFKTWIEHGGGISNPNESSYYYIMAPGLSPITYAEKNPVTLLENSEFVQAVKKVEPDGAVIAGIVYYPKNNFTNTDVDLKMG